MKKIIPLDYSLEENWVKKDIVEGSEYDVIYFYGTAVDSPSLGNGIGDVSEEMKERGRRSFIKNAEQLAKCGKTIKEASVFVPLQRQVALKYALTNTKTHEDLGRFIAASEPGADLFAIMNYYFQHFNINAEKPFILSGHSQGAASIQYLLEFYFIKGGHKDYLKKMIAAYSIGYGVSEKWFNSLDKTLDGKEAIHFATGPSDYNCVISWNTEGVGDKGYNFLIKDDGDRALVINPLNWKRDETYAGIEHNEGCLMETESGSFYISNKKEDLKDAQLDLNRGSVICSTTSDYVYLEEYGGSIWGGKSLHMEDCKSYYMNMRSNLTNRIDCFMRISGSPRI